MQHEIFEPSLEIKDTNITFNEVYKKTYISEIDIEHVKKANCLIIPNESFRDQEIIWFPETTIELFNYLKENNSDKIVSDIAVSDDEFKKIELHSATITLATILVEYVVLPISISLLANFIYDLVKKMRRKNEDTTAEINIVVEEKKHKKTKKITYKGPVSEAKETLDTVVKDLFDSEDK